MSIKGLPNFTGDSFGIRHGMRMFGGGGGGSTQTIQKSDPWSGQQPYLKQAFAQSQNLYNNQSDWPQYYPTSTVQGFNPMESSAVGGLYNLGTEGNSSLNSANDALTKFNSGDYLSAGNPYFQQMADSIKSTITPQIEAQFTQGNSMNNPAAAFATAQGTASALAPVAYQNYSDQLGNMIKSTALSPTIYQSQLAGEGTALGAGQTQQQQDQTQLSDLVNRYTYGQQLPFEMLNQYANSIQGNYGGTNTLSQPYNGSGIGGAISGGLGGALGGSALSSMLGFAGPWGALLGGGLGILSSLSK